MTKYKIEIQIILFAFVTGMAVITTGYFAYKSLSVIIDSIRREAYPDNTLYQVKDIVSDLGSLENAVRLYILTNEQRDLKICDTLFTRINIKLEIIGSLPPSGDNERMLTDSVQKYAAEKRKLWEGVLILHQTAGGIMPSFTKFYTELDKQRTDSVVIQPVKKGILQKIFGGGKTKADTVIRKRRYEYGEIKQIVRDLETDVINKGSSLNAVESKLIERNIDLDNKINHLILDAETNRQKSLADKTNEIDQLAATSYKKLALYTLVAICSLLTALFVLINYLKKSRAYQQALSDARQKAENLARAKEEFASNVSHELRTPVNAIYGLTEQVLQKPLNPEMERLILIISKSAAHLRNIINDTLDFSKIIAGKLKLESVDFSPLEICDEVLELHKYEAMKKGISLDFKWEGEIPEGLNGDPLRLKQILINLVNNALKFTDTGKVSMEVSAARNSENLFDLTFIIRDSGIGIPEEDLPLIFDEFVQIRNHAGRKYSGTGLGLFIVKKLVDLQNGRISVQSSPGKGTSVILNLCYREGIKNKKGVTTREIAPVPDSVRNLSVLVADDNEFNRFLLTNILKKWGIRHAEAKNGKETVDAALSLKYDVILMDLHMPEMNGIEIAEKLRNELRGVKIIAVSATDDTVTRQSCLEAGISGFISKPFSENELLDILSSLQSGSGEETHDTALHLDMHEFEKLAGGDMDFLHEMIKLFITSTDSALNDLQEMIKKEDWNGVMETAHKMSGPSKQIQAVPLYNLVRRLGDTAVHNPDPTEVMNTFLPVKEEAMKVRTILHTYLEENPTDKQNSPSREVNPRGT